MTDTVLITGASSGLGRAAAGLFQARGWNVVATMRRTEDAGRLATLDRVLVARLDVQDRTSIAAAIDAGVGAFGAIDVVVNNAGYGSPGPLEAIDDAEVRRQFDVNLFGPIAMIQALLPHFRARRSGAFVNVSSIGGRVAFPLGSLYHASKFALEGLSEALAYELSAIGVRVKLVEPGMIATDFAGRSLAFSNDPPLTEYQPTVQAVMAAFAAMSAEASSPDLVAETIFEAASDRTDKLRFEAGADAARLLRERGASGDQRFMGAIRNMFGLGM